MKTNQFDQKHVLHQLKHYLPSQTPLKDFIHHNSLHAFQHLPFYEAIFNASEIFGYQVTLELSDYRKLYSSGRIKKSIVERLIQEKKGSEQVENWLTKMLASGYNENRHVRVGKLREEWKHKYKIDLDSLVHPKLFRLLVSYLDQGIANLKFPLAPNGLLDSLRELERNSFTSFFNSNRVKSLLLNDDLELNELLNLLVGNEDYYEQYLFDQQFAHRGWSGMVSTIEQLPSSLYDQRKISLHDLILIELLFEIDGLDTALGSRWQPLCKNRMQPPAELFASTLSEEYHEILMLWQDAFEWSYYDDVLSGLSKAKGSNNLSSQSTSFQAIFCIDERECSLRRHIEQVDVQCETLGSPGFFGVEFYFQAEGSSFYEKLCPAPVTPTILIKEKQSATDQHSEVLYASWTHQLSGGLISSLSLGFYSAFQLARQLTKPRMSPAISNAFAHGNKHAELIIENKSPEDKENGLQLGFTVPEMTTRVESLLRSIGLVDHFAPLIYVVAHGSSSANNPHHGAHDCGACSGRPGSVNARVFAYMANHPVVRALLADRGIIIPESTVFIGSMHDTAADEMDYYDTNQLTGSQLEQHQKHSLSFEKALDLNAKERSRRFASIPTRMNISKIRQAIKERSVSLFEPRPELGHGTNTLCIVGRREMTKHLFLDRRAFLNSYDYTTDPEGHLLTGVMRPLGPVCGGINLEYYFSRVDNHKLGAGTKLPHHVMGLIGVSNSVDGDLRPGLPLQMIEVHDPVRLLIIVEHYPEIVLKSIQSTPEMYEWYINEWVHLIVSDPDSGDYFYFKNGSFTRYIPLSTGIQHVNDIQPIIEHAQEMKTNHITDATFENLGVYTITK